MLYKLEKITALKEELEKLRPFPMEVLQNLEKWFEIELTYSSNAIEGNTLTRHETALVLEKGLTVGGKSMKDHLEAINHRDAINLLKIMVKQDQVSVDDILSLHKIILKNIDDSGAGVIRNVPVRISGSIVIMPNPLKLPKLLDEFDEWLQKNNEHPVMFAAMAHYKLVSIHPFVDGNGRTARLLMNLILMRHGYPAAIIYPQNRLKYIKSLEKAQLGGSLEDYIQVILQAVNHSLNIYLKAILNPPEELTNINSLLKIGDLAKQANENIATIRYWVKMGLLKVTTTTHSGYQLFELSNIDKCKKIRQLQQKRYRLEEILLLLN